MTVKLLSPLNSPSGSCFCVPKLVELVNVMFSRWLWFEKNRAGRVSSLVLDAASKMSKAGMLHSSSSGRVRKALPCMSSAVTSPAPVKLNASGSKQPMLQLPRLLVVAA